MKWKKDILDARQLRDVISNKKPDWQTDNFWILHRDNAPVMQWQFDTISLKIELTSFRNHRIRLISHWVTSSYYLNSKDHYAETAWRSYRESYRERTIQTVSSFGKYITISALYRLEITLWRCRNRFERINNYFYFSNEFTLFYANNM